MNKQIIIALTLCMMFVGFASANGETSAIIGIGSGSGTVTMPISITNGANVGSVDVIMTFDPEIVTVTGVTNGNMDSMMPNLEKVGNGNIHIVAYQAGSPGLNGNFDVAQVTFKPVSSSGSCPLEMTIITFKDRTPTGNVMAYTVSNGTYTATSGGSNGGSNGDSTPAGIVMAHTVSNGTYTAENGGSNGGGGGGNGTYPPKKSATPKKPATTPGFEAVFASAGLLAIAYVKMRSRER